VYAVVESAMVVEEHGVSELLQEVETEVEAFSIEGYVSKLKFYLAPVDAFVEPAVVVPNIGGKNNSYLWLTGRRNWRDLFVTWLHKPHQDLTEDDTTEEESGLSEGERDDYSDAGSDLEQEEREATMATEISDDESEEEIE
jgi:hypothetical protein